MLSEACKKAAADSNFLALTLLTSLIVGQDHTNPIDPQHG
jgi:hypothetical protein